MSKTMKTTFTTEHFLEKLLHCITYNIYIFFVYFTISSIMSSWGLKRKFKNALKLWKFVVVTQLIAAFHARKALETQKKENIVSMSPRVFKPNIVIKTNMPLPYNVCSQQRHIKLSRHTRSHFCLAISCYWIIQDKPKQLGLNHLSSPLHSLLLTKLYNITRRLLQTGCFAEV